MTAGTPGFMAPERATNAGVDHRADVYGIGATVYCALTGREPPADGPPPRPGALRPGLVPEVDEVVLRALAHDPDARWPSAGEFGEALRALRTGTAAATPVPVPKPPRRHRVALSVVAGLVVVATTVAVATWLDDAGAARTTTSGGSTGVRPT